MTNPIGFTPTLKIVGFAIYQSRHAIDGFAKIPLQASIFAHGKDSRDKSTAIDGFGKDSRDKSTAIDGMVKIAVTNLPLLTALVKIAATNPVGFTQMVSDDVVRIVKMELIRDII